MVTQMRSAPGIPAPVYGQSAVRSVDERVRKATRQTPPTEMVEYVQRRLWELKPAGIDDLDNSDAQLLLATCSLYFNVAIILPPLKYNFNNSC